MHHVESDDNEALVPHTHAVLGLKLDDAEEASMVRRVGGAVLGLMALLVLHFMVHMAHHGHVIHALGHLLTAAVLPAVGYVAVSQRSSKAAWAFHMMAVVSSVVHAVVLVQVLVHLMQLQVSGAGAACAKFARPCEGDAIGGRPTSFSEDQRYWRCFDSALCIHGSGRCDHEVNCFDGSDETGCGADKGDRWKIVVTAGMRQEAERCEELLLAEVRAPHLKLWWLVMSLPMWGLCIFAAYHSLEFYVQLRVRRLAARVNRASADATVFERSDQRDIVGEEDVVAE
mmetsp:Transcript_142553/g.443328  ORF Transcript_142553/g.443328 Transcript_142553/m.443328 type:complete len:285 (+) Transcript_142553:112-966(+)